MHRYFNLKNSRSRKNNVTKKTFRSMRLYIPTHTDTHNTHAPHREKESARETQPQTTSHRFRNETRAHFLCLSCVSGEECDCIVRTRALSQAIYCAVVLSLQLFQQSDRHFQFHYTHDVCGDSQIVREKNLYSGKIRLEIRYTKKSNARVTQWRFSFFPFFLFFLLRFVRVDFSFGVHYKCD